MPTIKEIKKAQKEYKKKEARWFFYPIATELLKRARRKKQRGKFGDMARALCVLLYTWNNSFYKGKGKKFNTKHISKIEKLIREFRNDIEDFRARGNSIIKFCTNDKIKDKVIEIFNEFKKVLGPVGTAKALHLLAPRFFPLWDRKIAKYYGFPLSTKNNSKKHAHFYCCFIKTTKEQCMALARGRNAIKKNTLKALDEFNVLRAQRIHV